MLDSEQLEKLRKAGRVSAEARDLGLSMVDKGVRYFDVAEEVENYIRKNGCKLAFPCNISVNDIAAHYTPAPNDKLTFEVGDVVRSIAVHTSTVSSETPQVPSRLEPTGSLH